MEERCQLLVSSSDDLISGWQVQQGQSTQTGKVVVGYMQMTKKKKKNTQFPNNYTGLSESTQAEVPENKVVVVEKQKK